MKYLASLLLIACAGCTSTNVTKWQQAFNNGHPVIVNKLGTVYGTDYLVIIGQQTNTDVTVSPDGTVTVKSH
jgi:hypothetical protein